ncbi:DUF7594 domain-containing protein [Myxococcus stipitatus]|uniref:CBM96 family carbohydrate-binding protein n=1 Tax=Myxococcus stipitatus TaxID=83455 RepID=UPI0030D5D165
MKSMTWLSVIGLLSLGGVVAGGAVPVAADPKLPPECEPNSYEGEREELADADTYVEASSPDTAHGRASVLVADGNPRQEIYLRFEFWEGDFQSAWLHLPIEDGTSNAPALYSTRPDWNELTLTWNTRPALVGGPLANAGPVVSGGHVQYDVSQVVKGPGVYSFALIPESGDGMDISSRETWRPDRPKLTLPVLLTHCTYRGSGGSLGPMWRHGAQGDEVARAMATDATGAFVLAGVYGAGGALGPVPFPGTRGLMLGRFRADGSHEWSRGHAQESAELRVEDVALTSQGNILVVGSYTGTPDLGTGPLPAAEEATVPAMFIAMFSPDGVPVWAKGFVANLEQGGVTRRVPVGARAVATDSQGSLIVTGSFHGTMNLGGGVLDAGPSSRDAVNPEPGMFLARFSGEGAHLWSVAYPGLGGGGTQGFRVATDRAGNIVVGGTASGAGEDIRVLGARVRNTPIIARFSPEGALQWTRALEFANGQVTGLAILTGDAVAFSGRFWPHFYFGIGMIYNYRGWSEPHGSMPDAMVGVLESWGGDRWARAVGAEGHEEVLRMAVGPGDTLVVLGTLEGGADVGGGFVSTGGSGFVARYGSHEGIPHQWSRALPGGLDATLLGVTPTGGVLVGGSFNGTLRVRDVPYPSAGGADVMLMNMSR